MEEFSEKRVVSSRSKFLTVVKSSYSLRRTPARSDSESKPRPSSGRIWRPEGSNSSYAAKSQSPATLTPEPVEPAPRRYPSRVRVSAAQNLPPGSPITPSKSSSKKKEEEQEPESRRRLREFRELYYKMSREGVVKEPGERSRPDLSAYNLLRSKNKDLGSDNKFLGVVPGIEIGDRFEFRVELFLLGLHCQLLANIDYVTRDQRLVASSIVFMFAGRHSNNVRASADVLVCRGGGKEWKDQRMEGGNLALKNSIDEGTPVRVIVGFRDRQGKRITYVYGGLYSVEKYWRKKGQGCVIFLFQLKRLQGQTKLNFKEIEKSIRSATGGKDIDDGNRSPSKCANDETCSLVHRAALNKDSVLPSSNTLGEVTTCFGKRRREEEEESPAKAARSRKRVKQILHEFKVIYERLAEEYNAKQKNVHRKREAGENSRFDLDAYNLYKGKNKDMSNFSKHMGPVPGVEIGDNFHFRVELALLGLHYNLQAHVDYIRKDKKLLAVSIVSAQFGKYNTDVCKSDVLLVCGSGLKNRDQRMVNGNLALKNSIDTKNPIRIFYGFKKYGGPTLYVYYGLYMAERFWRQKDGDGHFVFMFRLKRLPGQTKIDIKETKKLFESYSDHKYSEDISRGKEGLPIRVVNTIDDERLLDFEYVTKVIYPSNYSRAPLEGCGCVNGCSDSETCACAVKNGGEIPFNSNGAIVEAKPLVYECGPSCKCPPSCHNRVSQHGMKFPLEIFKTETMGWGVRCRTFIPSGSFICEYVGELLEDEEAEERTIDEYLFAIGNNYYDESLWEGLSPVPCLQKGALSKAEEEGGFTIDASRYGNIGKFINHSCTPNLYAQNLLYDHDDKRMPHVMFFACEDIPPLQELMYHYNYTMDGVRDSDGNIKKKSCYCGSIECTGRLY